MIRPWMRGDPAWWCVTDVAEALVDGSLAAADYIDHLLARVERTRDLNVMIACDPKAVIAAAEQTDLRRTSGKLQRVLDGIPVVVDDWIDVAGLPTTGGTPGLEGYRPAQDAASVAALRTAGAIFLGKTNIHELALGVTGNNYYIGPARNPYAPDRIAGPSGGAAAAIASGVAPLGLVVDTRGGARISAALCGCVGFRPTHGRYQLEGTLPISSTRDAIGVIARSVDDIALVDRVLTGERVSSPPADLAGLRLAVPRAFYFEHLDAGVAALTERAITILRDADCVLIERSLARVDSIERDAGMTIAFAELARQLPDYLHRAGMPDFADVAAKIASPDVRALIEKILSSTVDPEHYRHALRKLRPGIRHVFADYFGAVQAVAAIVPTVPLPAPQIGDDDTTRLGDALVPVFETVARNTAAASIAGIPAISLPIGLTAEGLPVGLELIGPAGSDQALLAAARAVAAALPPMPYPIFD